jgi:hypothetical protein
MRKVTSFTISSDILTEISASKGEASTSERVNHLLRRALDLERREQLERQAADFFGSESSDSLRERAAYQKATRKTLSRD